jgi:ribosomal protein S18 acetylase RimI-like enzyme
MFDIRPMSGDDYDEVMTLLRKTQGVSFRDADSRENTATYLQRNPGLSFVATIDGITVGCIMSGHDGRRGYLQHLVVLPEYRRQGVATSLVERCLSTLAKLGIKKSHIDVLNDNETGAAYWKSQGWILRTDIKRYSYIYSGGDNV